MFVSAASEAVRNSMVAAKVNPDDFAANLKSPPPKVANKTTVTAAKVQGLDKLPLDKLPKAAWDLMLGFADNPAIHLVDKDSRAMYRQHHKLPTKLPEPKSKPKPRNCVVLFLIGAWNVVAGAFKAIGAFFKAIFCCLCCRGTTPLKVEKEDEPKKQGGGITQDPNGQPPMTPAAKEAVSHVREPLTSEFSNVQTALDAIAEFVGGNEDTPT